MLQAPAVVCKSLFVCLSQSDGDKALPVVHITRWVLAAYVLIPGLDGEHHKACNEKEFNFTKRNLVSVSLFFRKKV